MFTYFFERVGDGGLGWVGQIRAAYPLKLAKPAAIGWVA